MLLRRHSGLRNPQGTLNGIPLLIQYHTPLIQQLVLHSTLVAAVVVLSWSLQYIRMPPSVQKIMGPRCVFQQPNSVVDPRAVHRENQRHLRYPWGIHSSPDSPNALGLRGGRWRQGGGAGGVGCVYIHHRVNGPRRLHEQGVAVNPENPVISGARLVHHILHRIHLPKKRLMDPVIHIHPRREIGNDLGGVSELEEVVAVDLGVDLVVLRSEYSHGLILGIGTDRHDGHTGLGQPELGQGRGD
mmetsp:Transcript_125092/g.286624  ORF Transcript_125092/g.286624 Transcript_125092/m.286624 type:complete len:243 (-) Transcript_125092:225-953(-)